MISRIKMSKYRMHRGLTLHITMPMPILVQTHQYQEMSRTICSYQTCFHQKELICMKDVGQVFYSHKLLDT